MKCPTCGNDVSQEEVFCGQCGTPMTPPARPTEMVNAPPAPRSGRLGDYAGNAPFTLTPQQGAPRTRQLSESNLGPFAQEPGSVPNPSQLSPSGSNPQANFYQDATEAISSLPSRPLPPQQPVYPAGLQSQYLGNKPPYPPVQPPYQGNYPNQIPSQIYNQPPLGTGQGYMPGNRGKITTPIQPQQNNMTALIVAIAVIVVLVGVIGISALLILRNRGNDQAALPATPTVINAPTATPTPVPTATPSPTPEATPTPVPTATPAPDGGFQWCTPACAPYGFLVEYPVAWSPGAATNAPGLQYVNPGAPDEVAAFKAPGATQSQPGELLTNDLQTNFQSKPEYGAPTTMATATIGGTTWLTQTASYKNDAQQKVRVMVFATVYQQKAYIIELQARDDQFDQVYQQAFANMLKSFSFQPVPTA